MIVGGYGLYRAIDRRSHLGWMLAAGALLLGILATLSGGLRALPWDWLGMWSDKQDSNSGYRQPLQHNSAIVPQKYLDSL